MENSLQSGCQVSFKTVTRDKTSTILQSQSLKLVTIRDFNQCCDWYLDLVESRLIE